MMNIYFKKRYGQSKCLLSGGHLHSYFGSGQARKVILYELLFYKYNGFGLFQIIETLNNVINRGN